MALQEGQIEQLTSKSYSHLPTYYIMRREKRNSCWVEIATQLPWCFKKKKKTTTAHSTILWQKTVILVSHDQRSSVSYCSWNYLLTGKGTNIKLRNRGKEWPLALEPLFWIIWFLKGPQILPQHRTQTSDCPSCGDTWAWQQARWGGRHPGRGHLFWFLYPQCTRTPTGRGFIQLLKNISNINITKNKTTVL